MGFRILKVVASRVVKTISRSHSQSAQRREQEDIEEVRPLRRSVPVHVSPQNWLF